MRIGLYNLDHTSFPNYAMMKVSMYHKMQRDTVEMYHPLWHDTFDKVYAFSVFTFSDKSYVTEDMVCGGTGFDPHSKLPPEIEEEMPDYSLYPTFRYALGFLTRGCIRKCPWCLVPEKEGGIQPYQDVTQVRYMDRFELLLMDNNFLAAGDYAWGQAEKIVRLGYKVDFNQGLDARLVDEEWARMLARMKWIRFVRFSCDTDAMLEPVIEAAERIREYGNKGREIFVYLLVQDIDSALHRATELSRHKIDVFAQPYRDPAGHEPNEEQKRFARWVNHKAIFKTVKWEDYQKEAA